MSEEEGFDAKRSNATLVQVVHARDTLATRRRIALAKTSEPQLIPGNELCARCEAPLSMHPRAVQKRAGRRDVLCPECSRRHNLPQTEEIDRMIQEAAERAEHEEAPAEQPKAPAPKLGHYKGLLAKMRKEAETLRARKEAIAATRKALDAEEEEIGKALAALALIDAKPEA